MGSGFEGFVGDLSMRGSKVNESWIEWGLRCELCLDFTSTMGIPRVSCGYGVDEGVWLPCRWTTACLRLSSSHMGSNLSCPVYTEGTQRSDG